MIGAVVAAVVLTMAPESGASVSAPERLPACVQEDGSGQAVCVWDARHAGNGYGRSFVVHRSGPRLHHERFRYVSHRRAHRLVFGVVR